MTSNSDPIYSSGGTGHFQEVHYQRGAVTLVVVVSLLIAVTLATIYTAMVNLQELRISGNDYRTKQAFNNAEMGLEQGWAFLTRNSGDVTRTSLGGWAEAGGAEQHWFLCNSNADRTALCNNFLNAAADLSQWLIYADAITSGTPNPFTVHFLTPLGSGVAPETLPTIYVYASGSSDDLTAESQVQITLTSASPFAGDPPDVPVVAGGDIELSGSLDIKPRVYEAESGDAMAGMAAKALAGGDITIGGSLADTPNEYPDGETELQGNIWDSLFNISQEELKSEIDNGSIRGEILSDCSSLNQNSSGIKWIEGDCDINSNGLIGPDLSAINSCDQLVDDPLWLIIEGDPSGDKSKFNGSVNVWATIVFLEGAGELELTGNPVFRGSIFGENDIDFGAGNFQSEPNPYLLQCPGDGNSFFLVKEEGSWFDEWTEL
mgnify:CR=1 FL=1